jgi:hypothetical protein
MKFLNWIKRVLSSAFRAVKDLFVDVVKNAEAVCILSFSAIGLTAVLSEIPFHYALPAFIDAPMVIPVIAVLIVLLLITLMQARNHEFATQRN